MKRVTNTGRWNQDDSLGTLNYITPASRIAAARLVRYGVAISLSRPVIPGPDSNAIQPVSLRVLRARAGDIDWFLDVPTLPMHGWAFTHVDALSHAGFNGVLYNGIPASVVDSAAGAHRLGVQVLRSGVVSRGILIDVPWLIGQPYLDTSAVITVGDLEAWERRTGIRVGQGDVLLIRTGREARESALGSWRIATASAGLDPTVAVWLHARGVAVLGSDAASERYPSLVTGVSDPIHQLALVAMGMPIVDNLSLEALATEARRRRQWSFLVVFAPVPVQGGSGALINPLALF